MNNRRFLNKTIKDLEQSLTTLTIRTEKWVNLVELSSVMRNPLSLFRPREVFEPLRNSLEAKHHFLTRPLTDFLDSRLYPKLPDVEELNKRLQDLLEATISVVSRLARLGWFLPSPSIVLARELREVRSFRKKGDEEIDHFMCKLLEKRLSLSRIQEVLCREFTHRAEVIEQAFDAHQNGKYYLSIPVFLAQAEGISKEVTGKSVYSRYYQDEKPRNGKSGAGFPVYRDIIDGKGLDEYWLAYCWSFREYTALNARNDERDPNLLNRHAVLHGESTNYGTQINSLKAISFLLSVATTLSEALQDED